MARHPDLPNDELGFRDLVSFHALRRWRLVAAGCAGLSVLSVLSWFLITRREDPRVDMPLLNVAVAYPGASPEDVETQVVKPLEEVIYGMDRIKHVDSTAQSNAASFHVEFEEGVDMDVMAEKVRGRIQGKKADLPAEVKDPEVQVESTSLTPQMLVAVTGNASDSTLTAEAKRLKAELLALPGVSGIDLAGDLKPAIRVGLDPVRLAALGLSAGQIALAIQRANARIPGGEFRMGDTSTLLQMDQAFRDAASVQRVPVATSKDAQGGSRTLLLGSIADIADSTLNPKTRFLAEGKPGVALLLRFRAQADAVAVGKTVRARLRALEPSVPKGLSLSIVHDQPKIITKAVDGFARSLLEGILLVMGVVTLGLGWRPALVVSGVIPLAAGGAVLGLLLLGFSLEMISLAGLTMALGLLVDDAVVVTESIQLMRDKGLSPARAAVLGTARVFRANNGTTLVAFVSFLPLFFMGGVIGQFIRGLPAAVMIALAASLAVAQLATPWFSTLLLRKQEGGGEVSNEAPFDRSEDTYDRGFRESSPAIAILHRCYGRLMPWVIANPGRVAAAFSGLLALSLFLFPVIGLQFFPKSDDKPFLFVSVETAKGTHLDTTTRKLQEVMETLRKDKAVEMASAVAGGGYPGVAGDRGRAGEGMNVGDIMLNLREGEDPAAAAIRLRRSLSDVLAAKWSVDEIWMGPPVTSPIVVRIHGEDYNQLRSRAEEVKSRLRAIPGAVNLQDTLTDSIPITQVKLDTDRALRRGVNPETAGQTLRWLHGEDKITEFRRGDDLVHVVLEAQPDAGRPLGSLEDTPIPSTQGPLVPLKEAGTISPIFGYAKLSRRDGRRIVEVSADVEGGVLPATVLAQLDPWMAARNWEPGYGYFYAGEQEEVGKSFTNLGLAACGALVFIAALLLFLFNDFVLAGLVVALVPFVLIGALTGLALTRNPFGFMAFLGLIALVGVYVNHKIYFVDRFQELRNRGIPLETALLSAGQDRLRPVILTALTAVLGLLPLTLRGGPMWSAFGWVNIFGLMTSIPLSLILLPAFIVLVNRLRKRPCNALNV
ncbi:MAG: efflux RND transporter permease subunit [Acidobacteria bacterium]|nr:efflux RND transporter permease subunit [Acidobacteriota bacterium]MBI3486652.1 efflux RND transporter permease subunit [Acidobacteriota bacterium]